MAQDSAILLKERKKEFNRMREKKKKQGRFDIRKFHNIKYI